MIMQLSQEVDEGKETITGVLRYRAIDDLRPHPSLIRLQIIPSIREHSAAIERRSAGSREPLSVTSKGLILAGIADYEVARRGGELRLECFEMELSEEDAILWIIRKHRRSSGMNDFNRITLALQLEPWFKAKAMANQRLGGQLKASSNLTEADRCDVRAEVAAAAGVSTGNVTKTKNLLPVAHPELLHALRSGELTINKASLLIRNPGNQVEALHVNESRLGINRAIKALLSNHLDPKSTTAMLDLSQLAEALLATDQPTRSSIFVDRMHHSRKFIVISSALLETLRSQAELPL